MDYITAAATVPILQRNDSRPSFVTCRQSGCTASPGSARRRRRSFGPLGVVPAGLITSGPASAMRLTAELRSGSVMLISTNSYQ